MDSDTIQGRIPELTIKFTERPNVPPQGKRFMLTVNVSEQMSVVADLNAKSLRRQVKAIDEFEDWIGILSGKIESISAKGVITLGSAGVSIQERKKKQETPQEPKASQETGSASKAESAPKAEKTAS